MNAMTNSIEDRVMRLMARGGYKNPFGQRKRVHGDNRRVKLFDELEKVILPRFDDKRFAIDETGCFSRIVGNEDEEST